MRIYRRVEGLPEDGEDDKSRIGFAGGCTAEKETEPLRERFFREALKRCRLNIVEELIFNETKCESPIFYEERYCQKEGAAAMRYFHALAKPPTAVIAYNSMTGAALLHEAENLKLRLPDELSVISIDDYEFLDFLKPRLTVVDHVLEDMGRGAAELLIDLIENRVESPQNRFYLPELKIYESCKPLN